MVLFVSSKIYRVFINQSTGVYMYAPIDLTEAENLCHVSVSQKIYFLHFAPDMIPLCRGCQSLRKCEEIGYCTSPPLPIVTLRAFSSDMSCLYFHLSKFLFATQTFFKAS